MGQEHLAGSASLVEQIPEGLIGGVAEALEQRLAQIEPGVSAQTQLGLQHGAAMLKGLQRPRHDGPPDMHKRFAIAALRQPAWIEPITGGPAAAPPAAATMVDPEDSWWHLVAAPRRRTLA